MNIQCILWELITRTKPRFPKPKN